MTLRRFCLAAILALALPISLANAAPEQTKVLARDVTTQRYGDATVHVWLRDDPEYRRDLRLYRSWLAEAQADLTEARASIEQIGELTDAQRRSQQRFLAPFIREVQEAKARIAHLQGEYAKPYRLYGFRVQATGQRITLDWRVICERGEGERTSSGSVAGRSRIEIWRRPTIRRAYECSTYAETSSSGGRLVTSLLGRR